MKKIIIIVLIAFLAYFLVTDATTFADILTAIGSFFASVFEAIISVFEEIFT